ncbi:nuclear transport factor 2 family protein [Sphingomonas humi]|uniref:SnoaL-like domain-containing protein n=1 Tax=Sphingomonas humi TaxID=335630 RepID=A0ABP7S2M4_9SPHN
MFRNAAAIAALSIFAVPASAAPADDAVRAVTTVLDKFNGGDIQAFIEAHAAGAVIVDEFAPFQWGGEGSVQRWLGDYAKDAEARKIKDGRMLYGKPLQASASDSSAYIVLPTVYCLTQAGEPRGGEGTMTFVMSRAAGADWKIASWTYSAPLPSAATAKQGKCGKAKNS